MIQKSEKYTLFFLSFFSPIYTAFEIAEETIFPPESVSITLFAVVEMLSCFPFIENGKIILVEKNERINILKSPRNEKNTEQQEISSVPTNLTLNSLLENTRKRMGDEKFFTYDPVSNNCQDFLLAFLQETDSLNNL